MSNPTILSRLFSTSHLFARAVALTWQAHGPLALLTLVLMLVAAFVTPIQVWITKLVIDGVTSAVAQGVTSVRDPLVWRGLLLPLASYAGIWAVGQVIEGVDIQVRQLMGLQVNNYSQRLIFSKAAQLDIAFFENPAFYDQFTLARNEGIGFKMFPISSPPSCRIALRRLLCSLYWGKSRFGFRLFCS